MSAYANFFSSLKSKKRESNIGAYLLKIELSFRSVAQVSYKNEKGHVKIVRFYGNFWSKEISKYSNNIEDINFKLFMHCPNITNDESVKLSVEFQEKVLISQKFKIEKNKDFAGWFALLPIQQINLYSDYLEE